MPTIADRIAENLTRVRAQISQACQRAGRDNNDVTLVCVTKYARPEWIDGLLECGEFVLGESRPQQLEQRASRFSDQVQWHLIGQLQRNKVRRTLAVTSMIHSVDSMKLLERIDTIAADDGHRPSVLLQVNISGEDTKGGFTSDVLRDAWPRIHSLESVHVRGLMTMAPLTDDPRTSRDTFDRIRHLSLELGAGPTGQGGACLTELSMGMSNDFEIAIEAGATIIRLGRTLFEGLDA